MIWKWILARAVSNFGKVDEKTYRSGQGWMMLLFVLPFLKVDAVINLSHKPWKDVQDRFEEWLCRKRGIEYAAFPTVYWGDERFEEAYAFLRHHRNRRVLVHCEAGKDRTGGIIARYMWDLGECWTDILEEWDVHKKPAEDWLQSMLGALGS